MTLVLISQFKRNIKINFGLKLNFYSFFNKLKFMFELYLGNVL